MCRQACRGKYRLYVLQPFRIRNSGRGTQVRALDGGVPVAGASLVAPQARTAFGHNNRSGVYSPAARARRPRHDHRRVIDHGHRTERLLTPVPAVCTDLSQAEGEPVGEAVVRLGLVCPAPDQGLPMDAACALSVGHVFSAQSATATAVERPANRHRPL